MRLSEAIRLGAMMRPQAKEDLFVGGHSCALGAAYEAIGLMTPDTDRCNNPSSWHWRTRDAFPLLEEKVSCPIGDCWRTPDDLAYVTTHLNDEHGWTREAIADWVESVEREQQSPAVERTSLQDAVDVVGASEPLAVHARL